MTQRFLCLLESFAKYKFTVSFRLMQLAELEMWEYAL